MTEAQAARQSTVNATPLLEKEAITKEIGATYEIARIGEFIQIS